MTWMVLSCNRYGICMYDCNMCHALLILVFAFSGKQDGSGREDRHFSVRVVGNARKPWPRWYLAHQRAPTIRDAHLPFRRIGEASNPGPSQAVVASYNGNCWPRLREWLADLSAKIVFIQEPKRCKGEKYDAMSAQALTDGWKLCGTPATCGDHDGPRGGTAVLVRKHIGIGKINGW